MIPSQAQRPLTTFHKRSAFNRDAFAVSQSLRPPYRIGQAIIFSSCGFFFLLFLLFFSPILSRQKLDVYHLHYGHTWCGRSANLECKSEMCCMRLAENTERKKAKNSPSGHHRTPLSGYIFATKARIDSRKKC